MRKHQRYLFLLMAYVIGLLIGMFVKTNGYIFLLLSLPTLYVFWKGYKLEEKRNKDVDKTIEDFLKNKKP